MKVNPGAGDMDVLEFLIEFLENLQLRLTDEYILSSTILSIVVGLLACGCMVVAAIFMKHNRIYGPIAGVMQIVGAFSVQKMVHIFLEMDLFRQVTIYGEDMEDLASNVEDFYAEYFMDLLEGMVPMYLFSFLMMGAWIMGLIFIIRSMSRMPKVFPVLALLVHIFRYVFVMPYDIITPFFEKLTVEAQTRCDVLYYFLTLLPFLLVMIGSFLSKRHLQKNVVRI